MEQKSDYDSLPVNQWTRLSLASGVYQGCPILSNKYVKVVGLSRLKLTFSLMLFAPVIT